MHHTNTAHRYLPRHSRTSGYPLASLFSTLTLMISVSRERQQLRSLSAEALKDMGLDRADVAREVARPLWDLPACRMR